MGGIRWDIFCNVVDHYGDIGVSWRLARQLVAEYALEVRLWVDDLATFHHLCTAVDPAADAQHIEGVGIRRWRADADFHDAAAVVIEAFGSRIPEAYLALMAARTPAPVWVNLEYLSAEGWIEECHGGASPQPRLPLTKYFFFPGFTAATGGVLCEKDLESQRRLELAERAPRPGAGAVTTVSLFGYGGPAVGSLLEAWANGAESVLALVPESRILPDVTRFFGAAAAPGQRLEQGSVAALILPFQPLDQYDRLLWTCDCNFVRGEDSFVRAQWARRP
ncbi:MAG: elongation factor P maturation arginine rhamnosyltransferase EarP, partial [Casimicrobiaceae bacterium]